MTDPTARDIPASVLHLALTAPRVDSYGATPLHLSQVRTAELLAHYWPAIEEHFRDQLGREIEAFAQAAGHAKDPGEIGFLGGLAVAEIVVRRKGPGLNEMVAGLLAPAAPPTAR